MSPNDTERSGALPPTELDSGVAAPGSSRVPRARFDAHALRADFPLLADPARGGGRAVYLDWGATSQKPRAVLDAERGFYLHDNGAPHRGSHQLAERATVAYEGARDRIAAFIGASPSDIVFTRNATDSINLVAYAILNATLAAGRGAQADPRLVLRPGDEILVTEMEHHANLVPWQELAAKTGAVLRWFPVTPDGRLDLDAPDVDGRPRLTDRTRMVAFTHQSNVLGTINPVAHLVAAARAVGALVLLDACQSVPHMPVDVTALGADFVAFSGHKMLGPMGIGVLHGRTDLLDAMPPVTTGGSMIELVRMESSTYAAPPQRFEAGVPAAAQAVGLAAACDYLAAVGMDRVATHEAQITEYALAALGEVPGLRILGPTSTVDRGGSLAFDLAGCHPHDVGQVLDHHGVMVRTGHHCAWPLHRALGVTASTRASIGLTTGTDDIDALVAGLHEVRRFFRL